MRIFSSTNITFLFSFILVIANSAFASQITLEKGLVVEGEIVEQNEDYVKVLTQAGVEISYYWDEIADVDGATEYVELEAAEDDVIESAASLGEQSEEVVGDSIQKDVKFLENEIIVQKLRKQKTRGLMLLQEGLLLFNDERYEEARDKLEESISVEPSNPETHYNLGVIYAALDDRPKAREAFLNATKIDDKFTDAFYNLGLIYGYEERNDDAIASLKRVVEVDPKYVEAYYNLGVLYGSLDRNEEAKEALEETVKLNPENGDAWLNLGIAYSTLDRQDEAVECFEKSIRINPSLSDAHFNLGIVYGGLAEYQKAKQYLSRAVQLSPSHARAYFNLGVAHGSLSEFDDAKQHFVKARTLFSRSNDTDMVARINQIMDTLP